MAQRRSRREKTGQAASIESRIMSAYGKLSQSERRLADVILAQPGGISEFAASELAELAEVSRATTARFFQRLGYLNYRSARLSAREHRRRGSPLEAMHEPTAPLEARGNFGIHLANDLANLTRSGESIDPGEIDAAVQMLERSRRIFVVGFRNSYSLAAYAFGVLNTVRPGVILLAPGNLDVVELLADIGPGDALLAMGFRRRPTVLRQLLAAARTRQAKTLLICDNEASTTRRLADIPLVCDSRGTFLFDSYVCAMSLINFLCSSTALALGPPAWRRLEDIEKLHDTLNDLATREPDGAP
ncbi:MAG: MurR/RpiR family transcriptional regulator [Gammaproteobacteria bacterium]|nr:MurR/RpiR family transcriptional regulator [Gammaproteobacteria bacterium]